MSRAPANEGRKAMPQPLPSLFGRFTAILRDHDHLAQTLRELRVMCAAIADGRDALPSELTPARLIGELRDDLAEHFEAEESDDYFGVVVDEEPELTSQIAALKWEHLAMLRAVDALVRLAEDRSRWPQLPSPTRDLISQLERHERAESVLLRNLFSSAAAGRQK
jgi:hypothetical protein